MSEQFDLYRMAGLATALQDFHCQRLAISSMNKALAQCKERLPGRLAELERAAEEFRLAVADRYINQAKELYGSLEGAFRDVSWLHDEVADIEKRLIFECNKLSKLRDHIAYLSGIGPDNPEVKVDWTAMPTCGDGFRVVATIRHGQPIELSICVEVTHQSRIAAAAPTAERHTTAPVQA